MKRALPALLLLSSACATHSGYLIVDPLPAADGNHAAARGCQGGCALVRDPADALTSSQIEALLVTATRLEVGADSEALDSLLFHDNEVRAWFLEGVLPAGVSPEWAGWLRQELHRRTATFSLRIIDEHGVVRAQVPATPMALGMKLHIQVDDGDHTGPFNANGTIVRVGRDHVWIRM
ncbi:MAG: hypothetical protein H6Q89_3086 [Myxococcaceae bacterium]|nr:hypothetical protein [Myxococcaceae bacterium]